MKNPFTVGALPQHPLNNKERDIAFFMIILEDNPRMTCCEKKLLVQPQWTT